MLNPRLMLIGVLAGLSLSKVPSKVWVWPIEKFEQLVAEAEGRMAVNDPEKSILLSMKAMPAGLNSMLSAPNLRAVPVWPIPVCLVERVFT